MIITKHNLGMSEVKIICQTFEYIANFFVRTREYWSKSIPNIINNNILIFNNLYLAPLTENAFCCSINRQHGGYIPSKL